MAKVILMYIHAIAYISTAVSGALIGEQDSNSLSLFLSFIDQSHYFTLQRRLFCVTSDRIR